MPIQICRMCKTNFYVKASWLKMGNGVYCSAKCQHFGARRGRIVYCYVCKIDLYRSLRALTNSKSKKYFCSKSCQTKWRNTEFIGSKHSNWVHGRSCYKGVLSRADVSKKCVLCKITDIRVLAVHHIDKNHSNNKLENLSWLCHNCHHLVHHYQEERERFMVAIV